MATKAEETYLISNPYGTIIYEGKHISSYAAWLCLWEKCQYPQAERSILKMLEQGFEISKK